MFQVRTPQSDDSFQNGSFSRGPFSGEPAVKSEVPPLVRLRSMPNASPSKRTETVDIDGVIVTVWKVPQNQTWKHGSRLEDALSAVSANFQLSGFHFWIEIGAYLCFSRIFPSRN